MISYHFNIQIFVEDGWYRKKLDRFYILLEKDVIRRKVALETGNIVSETKVKPKKKAKKEKKNTDYFSQLK